MYMQMGHNFGISWFVGMSLGAPGGELELCQWQCCTVGIEAENICRNFIGLCSLRTAKWS